MSQHEPKEATPKESSTQQWFMTEAEEAELFECLEQHQGQQRQEELQEAREAFQAAQIAANAQFVRPYDANPMLHPFVPVQQTRFHVQMDCPQFCYECGAHVEALRQYDRHLTNRFNSLMQREQAVAKAEAELRHQQSSDSGAASRNRASGFRGRYSYRRGRGGQNRGAHARNGGQFVPARPLFDSYAPKFFPVNRPQVASQQQSPLDTE